MTRREFKSAKNQLDELESDTNTERDMPEIVIRRGRVDSEGEFVEVVKKTRCGFDENGDWYSEEV